MTLRGHTKPQHSCMIVAGVHAVLDSSWVGFFTKPRTRPENTTKTIPFWHGFRSSTLLEAKRYFRALSTSKQRNFDMKDSLGKKYTTYVDAESSQESIARV